MMTHILAASARLNAQVLDISDWFGFDPFGRTDPGTDPQTDVFKYVRTGLILAIVGLAIAWVVTALLIAIKFITSVGNADEFGKAATGLKNLIVGITLAFIIVVILLLVANAVWKP